MNTTTRLFAVLLTVTPGCGAPARGPAKPAVPPPAALDSVRAEPGAVIVSEPEREAEAEHLRALGLDVPAGGPVLAQPFAPPWTRRSLVVPSRWLDQAWERLEAGEPVVASAVLADLDVLEAVMSIAYPGWESAEARGWDWARWFDDWRAMLSAHGDEPLAQEQAFAPVKALMDTQLDNHTNIPLGLRLGSVSGSAVLSEAPSGRCTRARHADGSEHALSPDDAAQHPRRAWRRLADDLVPIHYVAYPSGRGALTQLECGGRWIEASAAWSGPAPTAALAHTREDVPAYRQVSPDIALVRLPTPSRAGRERLAEVLPEGPSRGTERALIVDLRDNGGGGADIDMLSAWIEPHVFEQGASRFIGTEGDSCLHHGLRWTTMLPSLGRAPAPASAQGHLDALFEPGDGCERRFVPRGDPAWVYQHRFVPEDAPPPLRIVVLTNQMCASDCEWIVSVLGRLPHAVVVGTNTAGVGQFTRPGYSVLPHTRLPYRIATGTSDLYGDGRSFDGYGLDVDILLTTEAEHQPDAIIALVDRLLSTR